MAAALVARVRERRSRHGVRYSREETRGNGRETADRNSNIHANTRTHSRIYIHTQSLHGSTRRSPSSPSSVNSCARLFFDSRRRGEEKEEEEEKEKEEKEEEEEEEALGTTGRDTLLLLSCFEKERREREREKGQRTRRGRRGLAPWDLARLWSPPLGIDR